MPNLDLLGTTSRVETPYIKVTIGNYTFGVYQQGRKLQTSDQGVYELIDNKYPNYIHSLSIQKLNGAINTYTLTLVYPITENNDPNYFEKVLSSVSKSRKIIFSYGDLSVPTYIYKDEEALITNVSSQLRNTSIIYNINAVSNAYKLNSTRYTFPATSERPSVIIRTLLDDVTYNLKEIFYGMKDSFNVDKYQLIPNDDQVVTLETQHCTVLDYLLYLVSSMVNVRDNIAQDSKSFTKTVAYFLTVSDDTSGIFGGPYFKINTIDTNISDIQSLNLYEINVGTLSKDIVMNFTIDDNQSYAILYDYAETLTEDNLARRIDDNGNIYFVNAPSLRSNITNYKLTERERTWWTNMTSFPISATLTLKGLLKPSILMSYIKLNVYYYGHKHISSGIYAITKQVDTVDTNGFRTVLSLSRLKGDIIEY